MLLELSNENYLQTEVDDDEPGGVKLDGADLLQNIRSNERLPAALAPAATPNGTNLRIIDVLPGQSTNTLGSEGGYQLDIEREFETLRLAPHAGQDSLYNPLNKALKLNVSSPLQQPAYLAERSGNTKERFNGHTSNGVKLNSSAQSVEATTVDSDAPPPDNNAINLLHTQSWNPSSRDYNPELFFNAVIEMYRCPFLGCHQFFKRPSELGEHLEWAHRPQRIRCPTCLNLFKTFAGLVAHCEAPAAKCKIAQTAEFSEALDAFTGGFLQADDGLRPDMTREQDGTAMTYVKFEAAMPLGMLDATGMTQLGDYMQ